MRFDNIINNILKEEAPSREDRIKAMDNSGKEEGYNSLNTETVLKLYAPILEGNVTIKEGSPQAYKLWRKLVIELCEVECNSQKSERRGYATV
jgi:hypothetical protein